MNYLPMMTEDEIKYVCSVIPIKESVWYFKHYPKDFAKVMPGFRAKSLRNQEQVSAVLFRSRNQPFIFSFIEKHINHWIEEIQEEISRIIEEGESKESAWLQTLPFCFFVDYISIFFKLIGEELSEEKISILEQSIKRIRDLDVERKKLEDSLGKSEQEQEHLKEMNKKIQDELEALGKKLLEYSEEIQTLKQTNVDLEKMVAVVREREQEAENLEKKLHECDEIIKKLKTDLSAALEGQLQLEVKVREELKRQEATKFIAQAASSNPRCPKDIDEFRDYLGYNLENIGIETSSDYYSLLKNHLCEILFMGKPIIVSRKTGITLGKCISNALISSTSIATLVFVPNISVEAIEEFLTTKNRVVCLDNFIGNFDEAVLVTILERHRDMIIFLTVAYDKTLRYVPEEFMKYCHYLNINRIGAFIQERELTEDPSTIEEMDVVCETFTSDELWSSVLKNILEEVGVSRELTAYKCLCISDEETLIRVLTFDILPYCVDILNVVPFEISERLNKYAGENGRCPYKELLRRWFS